jgi:predicted lactoylglutathione lyase
MLLNMPVADLERSKAFFAKLGCRARGHEDEFFSRDPSLQ